MCETNHANLATLPVWRHCQLAPLPLASCLRHLAFGILPLAPGTLVFDIPTTGDPASMANPVSMARQLSAPPTARLAAQFFGRGLTAGGHPKGCRRDTCPEALAVRLVSAVD